VPAQKGLATTDGKSLIKIKKQRTQNATLQYTRKYVSSTVNLILGIEIYKT